MQPCLTILCRDSATLCTGYHTQPRFCHHGTITFKDSLMVLYRTLPWFCYTLHGSATRSHILLCSAIVQKYSAMILPLYNDSRDHGSVQLFSQCTIHTLQTLLCPNFPVSRNRGPFQVVQNLNIGKYIGLRWSWNQTRMRVWFQE